MALTTKSPRGFTLVELVLGIVVMGIALGGLMMPYFSMMENSVDPVLEAKGAVLAQQISKRMSEVSYDEMSDHDGSLCRCGENLSLSVMDASIDICPLKSCTSATAYGIDTDFEKNADSIDAFNDFDDFDTDALCERTTNSKVKGWCQKSESISKLCKDKYCISAEFFALSDFKNAEELQRFGAMFDSGFKNFYVSIRVDENILPPLDPFNQTSKEIKLKRADITVIAPRGAIYQYELYRGNY